MRRAVLAGLGHCVPDKVLSNAHLEAMMDTSDEWIRQRTGICERRISVPGQAASDLAIVAAREAVERAGVAAESLDLVVCGTVTGDMPFPSTACFVQAGIGATKAGAFDVGAACAGFIYSLAIGSAFVESGQAETVLVIGVDVLTKFVDWGDRSTAVLFGDGAGAAVLRPGEGDRGVIKTVLLSDGNGAPHIDFQVGGSRYPHGSPEAQGRRPAVAMNGAEVYRFAVRAMGDACLRVLAEAGLQPSDVDLFVPHQANLRIIRASQERLGLTDDRVFVNVQHYGNTSGGSIPLALYEAERSGRLKPGALVLTVGFGAGLVWGANLIRW